MTLPLIFAWFGSCVLLAAVGYYRQRQYTMLLAQQYPDSDYAQSRLGRGERPAMAWHVVGSLRKLERDRLHEMSPTLLRARNAARDARLAAVLSMLGGAVLIIAMVRLAPQEPSLLPAAGLFVAVVTSVAMAVTSTIVVAAIRAPGPYRFQYVVGAALSLVGTVGLARILVG